MRWIFVFLVLFGLVGESRAENRARAREAFQRGTQHYDLSEYEAALQAFKDAYRDFEEPTFLFNIAQCYRQLGNHEMALRFYRTYLIKVPAAPNREEVRALITQLGRADEEERQRRAVPPQGTMGPSQPLPAAEPSPPAVVSVVTLPVVARDAGRRKLTVGLTTAGAGLVGVIVGATLLGLSQSISDELAADDRNHRPFDAGKEQSGRTDQLAGGVVLGIGAAALVAGATVAILGARERRSARLLTVVPVVGLHQAAAQLQVTF